MKKIHHILLIVCATVALSLGSVREVRGQQVALKLNSLMYAGLTPNVGCELVVGEHSSVDLSVFGHYHPYGLESAMIGVQPEYRYWFNGRPMVREYVGGAMLYSSYDMSMGGQVFDGDAIGAGLTGGYVFTLSKRWNLELSGGFGLLFFHQKQSYRNDNYDDYFVQEAVKANAWGYKLFPIKLGVTFSYIIK